VEIVLLLPLVFVLLLGTVEFGMGFMHHLTAEDAAREGARVGAALRNETGACTTADRVDRDDRVVAAVQRVLTSPGSFVDVNEVVEIRIYQADASGRQGTNEGAHVNVWVPGTGSEPAVEGMPLIFTRDLARQGWDICTRKSDPSTDAIGVSVTYEYKMIVENLLNATGAVSLQMTDRTVMPLDPS
jgi:Flp pilus assembly protein TadG